MHSQSHCKAIDLISTDASWDVANNFKLQHKPDEVYEWVWEELLHMDLLWGIQDLGQDVSGEDVWARQWRCGIPTRGMTVQWSQGWILALVYTRVQAWSLWPLWQSLMLPWQCVFLHFLFQSSLVKFNDHRPEFERNNQLFFAAFEWRDPYIQEIKLVSPWKQPTLLLLLKKKIIIKSYHVYVTAFFHSQQLVTANAWSSIAILCGVFMALFKAANFAKLTIQWIIRMRKRYLRNKAKEMTPVTDNWAKVTVKWMTGEEFCYFVTKITCIITNI